MTLRPLMFSLPALLLLVGCPKDPEETGDTDIGSDTDPDTDTDTELDTDDPGAETVVCDNLLPIVDDGICVVSGDPATATHVLIEGTVLGDATYIRGGVLMERGDNGLIECTGCDCVDEAPEETLVVSCPDGVVSPGLINAHDHIRYAHNDPVVLRSNERFDHRHDWREGRRGHTEISSGGQRSTTENVLYGEVRMLLGGATSIAGSIAGVDASGLLRNLDSGQYNEGLRSTETDYSTFPLSDIRGNLVASGCGDYDIDSPSVLDNASYLPHIAEGIDVEANNEFRCTSSNDGGGVDLIAPNTAIVHGIGVTPTDISLIAGDGAQLVWSPRSNISLYGMTASVTQYDTAGVRIALGTDWTPSGSATLLRELTCAADLNRNYYDGYFSDEDLWRMATEHGAVAMGADDQLGRLAEGYVADITVFDGTADSAHSAVVNADQSSVVAVFRGGDVLSGDADVIEGLRSDSAQCDIIDVCGIDKRVCVGPDAGLTLAELQSAAGSSAYPLVFCDTPLNEPTCEPLREDEDGDGIIFPLVDGMDMDMDGIVDAQDNCPTIFNPPRPLDGFVQGDFDNDGLGDDCDECPLNEGVVCTQVDPFDVDGDGVDNADDNCPGVANANQTDADQDGLGAECDACDDFAAASGACDALVYDIKQGSLTGDLVVVSEMVVVGEYDAGIFMQLDPNTALIDYSGVGFSGLYAYMPDFEPRPAVGSKITIEGVVSDFFGQIQLDNVSAVTVDAASVPLPPYTVLTPAQANADEGSEYESIRVEVTGGTVTDVDPEPGPGDERPTNQYVLSGEIRVDDHSYLTDPFPSVGESFTAVRGILRWGNGQSQLLPQGPEDILAGDATLAGIDEDDIAIEAGSTGTVTVSLTREADADTTVAVSCPGGLVSCPPTVVVPDGQRSASLTLNGINASDADSVVTVTLGDASDTLNVRVYDDASARAVASISPSVLTTPPGATVTFTVTLDIPAGSNETATIATSGDVSAPASVAIDEGNLTADFDVTVNGDGAGPATVDVTLNGTVSASLDIASVTNDPNLFFSRYIEGSGSGNKAVEITNATNSNVDPSRCTVQLYRNGNTEPQGVDWTLSGPELAPGDEFVLCNNGFSQAGLCDQTATIDFNGDDGVALVCDGNLVDFIGQANGIDVGSEWAGSDDESTANQTLVRKCDVVQGDTDPSDAFDPSLEWDGFPQDTFTNLGDYSCQ